MSESDLYNDILTAHSHGNTRVFRQNSGLAWQGTVIERTPTRLILAYPRAIKLGVPGLADIGGLTAVEITGSMIGTIVGVYLAIEGKSVRGRIRPEQQSFIDLVRRLGGRSGIARSAEDAGRIIQGNIL